MITRRQTLVLLCSGTALALLGSYFPALAQNVSVQELATPGPLGDVAQGPADAKVTIVEYASLTCSHCAAFHQQTYPALKERYIDTGKVRFIFREFPLDQLALAGFLLARCAGPDKYFPMIDTLFHMQKEWVTQKPLPPLLAIAKQAGMSEQAFNECLQDQKLIDGIEDVRQRAMKLNVQSTPSFFINGKPARVFTIDEFEKAIAPYLKG